MLRDIPRVALIYDARLAYDLKVMAGVAAYLQEGAQFSIYIEENALKDQRLPDLRTWMGDGIIADFDDPGVATAVKESKLPAVGFGSGYGWYVPESGVPYFFTNNQAISRLAADHLVERGLRHFGYCGYPQTAINGWSQERERAFVRRVAERGFTCEVYRGRHKTGRQWAQVQRSLGTWLGSLKKPVGLMAANDNRARQVLEACRACNLRVPEEVAVIGVDNDELLCQLSSPLLTSIEQGAKRIGYNAATLLDGIMRGKRPRRLCSVIDPVGVVTRQSTDILSIKDPTVAKAMTFIQEQACKGIKVPDVVNAVAVSRSGLESHFRMALDCTVHTAIRGITRRAHRADEGSAGPRVPRSFSKLRASNASGPTSSDDRPLCLENPRAVGAELFRLPKTATLHFKLNQDNQGFGGIGRQGGVSVSRIDSPLRVPRRPVAGRAR